MPDTEFLLEFALASNDPIRNTVPLLYDELRVLARKLVGREQLYQSLQATALVHEVFLRLVQQGKIPLANKAHFMGIAAKLMRQVLVDRSRTENALKRGGKGIIRITLSEIIASTPESNVDLLVLDEALTRFEADYPRESLIVDMKVFGGLSTPEISEALGISEKTTVRGWRFAQAWLSRELAGL